MQTRDIQGGVGHPKTHDSAHLHVTGEALYIDDLPEPQGLLHAAIGVSSQAHAHLASLDLTPVREAPGVVKVVTAQDIPGTNDYGAIVPDDPIFASSQVEYVGQSIFAVAARTVEQARRAARMAVIDYEPLPAILSPDAAREQGSFVLPTETLARGDAREALETAPHCLHGTLHIGGQDQFYLEGQIALAIPQEDGAFLVYSSTQYPSEVQQKVAHALGLPAHRVTVVCRRMGGGFGGKESQPALFACIAALLTAQTKRPVKLRLDRDDDMIMTGKRHDFTATYEVGFDDCGQLQGLVLNLASRCGMSADLSGPVNDRAMFHCDNCYYLPHVAITSHRCKTHTVSNTAFRGFGGPQGMMVIEYVIDEVARYLGLDPLDVRKRNFYGIGERDITPYAMRVEDNIIEAMVTELEKSAHYHARRREIEAFNTENLVFKRGLALTPVKFGIAFTATHLNQAGALLHVYTDGSVQLNHGGTEMGQGLFTKVAQVVAEELQIDIDRITTTATDTSKVPNASATAASSGSDLNGKAAQAAARTIKKRLIAFAAEHFDVPPDRVIFRNNRVEIGKQSLTFAELVELAYFARVSLSATGFFRTPKIHYDRETFSGCPFLYFSYGAAVSEVIIDTLTGEYQVSRVDILHDVGHSLNPAIDRGQIEGGFLQGMGWLTTEELWWNADGVLQTHAPSTYKIPTCRDWPADVRLALFESGGNREDTIYRSKAVGEPPLMLAISVFHALKDAIASVANTKISPHLNAPATPEAVLMAIEDVKGRATR
ncbi:xanthine dehydrogenase molybdopterin binding subunit [Candidatus Entotheonella serta]|nr:xanthine dehydrogenase molybdopterin binding subunit [Candidatus Entotheonella serta]